ncbi:MAG: acyloxyacyl hydrolase [Acidobacteriota bacterium]
MLRYFLVFAGLALGAAFPALAEDPVEERPPVEWIVTAGAFDVGVEEVAEAGIELRFGSFELPLGQRSLPLGFTLGGMVNDDGGYYLWSGFRYDWHLNDRWRVTPSLGTGIYSAGEGKNLGGPVEFRSSLEISFEVADRTRLSLNLYHLSNGILYDLNPGSESLVLGFHRRF